MLDQAGRKELLVLGGRDRACRWGGGRGYIGGGLGGGRGVGVKGGGASRWGVERRGVEGRLGLGLGRTLRDTRRRSLAGASCATRRSGCIPGRVQLVAPFW